MSVEVRESSLASPTTSMALSTLRPGPSDEAFRYDRTAAPRSPHAPYISPALAKSFSFSKNLASLRYSSGVPVSPRHDTKTSISDRCRGAAKNSRAISAPAARCCLEHLAADLAVLQASTAAVAELMKLLD